jgi:uncharacterized protein YaaN involved in tellurite resistance
MPVDSAETAGSGSFVPRDPAERDRIDRSVVDYLERLASLAPGSTPYARAVAAIDRLGQREFATVAALTGQMLDRRLREGRSALEERGPIAHRLAELRRLVDDLTPPAAAGGEERPKRRGPFGRRQERDPLEDLEDYLERSARSRDHLRETLLALEQSRLLLERDNSLLGRERVSLEAVMEALREHAYLVEQLDAALEARIVQIGLEDPARSDCLRQDVLFALRRRRMEIVTQLAVAAQGAAALLIVEDGNERLIHAIEGATTTTTAALRTAAIVAQAVASQRAALDQLKAAEAIAGEFEAMLASEALPEGGGGPEAARARVRVLHRAWADVQTALDGLEAQKAQVARDLARAEAAQPK